ncbi:pilus assembly protein CpaB [Nocardioides cavernae]|uniref:Pilus assembly protein CpaB n=1 Tax=Nocardioides cavernae TaxID=1921566 RepID=A0A7Y9H732_9ACTN|nr:Flp pilus assembly protein CpaB [Nocardioides cavernae]NYE38913.1 pilus assembly protein CpaB [Nocardioides cavernae]
MARRSMLLIVAVLIAALGTAMIVLYVKGIDDRATEGQELVEVLVATSVIEAGETVSSAQDEGKFDTKEVRRDDMVDGALNSTDPISELVALGSIYPGEQIIADRFGTIGAIENLVIPDDKMAMSVELTDFERVAGFVNPGSEVAIFLTSAAPIRRLPDGSEQTLSSVTRIVLPRVPVIGVGTTSVSSRTVTTEEGDQVTEEVPRTILTVAVTQEEAEKLILADRTTELTFALLGEDTKSVDKEGAYPRDILPETYRGNAG